MHSHRTVNLSVKRNRHSICTATVVGAARFHLTESQSDEIAVFITDYGRVDVKPLVRPTSSVASVSRNCRWSKRLVIGRANLWVRLELGIWCGLGQGTRWTDTYQAPHRICAIVLASCT